MKRSRWYALGVSLLSGCALLTPKIGSASAALHESVEATSPNFGELGVGTVRGSTPFDTKHGTGREDFVPFAVRDQVKRATRVTLDLAPIFEGNREGSASVLEFEGFPGETHRFQRFSLRGVNGITWTGRLVGSSEHGEAVVSRSGSSAYGVVEVGSKRYIFQSDSDHEGVLWEVDPSKEHACAVEGEGESHLSKASANTKVGGATDIDLLVYFTEEVGLDASPLINTMVASANVGMAASGVNATVNVVGYRRIDTYNPETGAEFGLAAGAIYVGNDEWSGTATLRDDLGADLVVLLVEPPDPETQETCGIVGTNLAPLQLSDLPYQAFTASIHAFAVVAANCAVSFLTFTHEIGHLMGAWHDWPSQPSGYQSCGIGGQSCGYTEPGGEFRTITSLGATDDGSCSVGNCPRLNRWSDKSATINLGGNNYRLGDLLDTKHDVVGTLDGTTVAFVAGYRDPTASAPGTLSSFSVSSCYSAHAVSWTDGTGVEGWFEVESSANSGFSFPLQVYRGGGSGVLHEEGGSFYLRARACNGLGCGGWSTSGLITSSSCV